MATWSPVWKSHTGETRVKLIQSRAFTPPSPAKKRIGGKYPHLQPFFKNRQKERIAA